MSHPFLHPSSGMLIERVARAFRGNDAYLVPERNLLFVCGGPVDAAGSSLRKKFLQYAQAELPNFRVFLAEAALQDIFQYNAPDFINLALFEDFIAEFADCILLFPESPGSFAEIGFFAAYDRILKKLLVANNLSYQAADSFINNGPISLINGNSIFRPVIYIDHNRASTDFAPIKDRLGRFPRHNRSRFIFAPYDALGPKERLAIILEIIKLFAPISLIGIQYIVDKIFSNANLDQIKHLVSLTLSVGYIYRVGLAEDHFATTPGSNTLFVLNKVEITRVRLSILDFYRHQFPNIYELEGIVHDDT